MAPLGWPTLGLDDQQRVNLLLVHEPMSAALQVHVLSVDVVETAVAQSTVEAVHFTCTDSFSGRTTK